MRWLWLNNVHRVGCNKEWLSWWTSLFRGTHYVQVAKTEMPGPPSSCYAFILIATETAYPRYIWGRLWRHFFFYRISRCHHALDGLLRARPVTYAQRSCLRMPQPTRTCLHIGPGLAWKLMPGQCRLSFDNNMCSFFFFLPFQQWKCWSLLHLMKKKTDTII